jgi:hypothetical protein
MYNGRDDCVTQRGGGAFTTCWRRRRWERPQRLQSNPLCGMKGKTMKKGITTRISLACLLALILFLASSCVYVHGCDGSWSRLVKYERQVELSAGMAPGSSLSAQTRDGSIQIEGIETNECRLTATIVAHATTEERAQELAEQIDVRLVPSTGGLTVVIDKPDTLRNARYGVSLEGTVPTRTDLSLVTSDGSVQLANIEGTVDAKTSDGSIRADGIRGDTRLRTSDGSIHCSGIEGDTLDLHTSDGQVKLANAAANSCKAETSDGSITLTTVRSDQMDLHTSDGGIRCEDIRVARLNCRTSDGSVHIECAADSPRALEATVTTSDGSITFTAPPDLSAVVDASVSDGSIHTSLPITVQGKVGKSLMGTVGAGEGRITLRTHDGSITIR